MSPLKLPQNCTPAELAARNQEIGIAKNDYVWKHDWAGYPPYIDTVPDREKPDLEDSKTVASGFKLIGSQIKQAFRYAGYLLKSVVSDMGPFDRYTCLYGADDLPEIGKNDVWRFDAVFAAQRLNGMYPWFIERVVDFTVFQLDFPITDDIVDGILPPGKTLAALANENRLYKVSQWSLEGAPGAHDHVITAPTSLFFVTEAGQLLTLGIQLYPKTAPNNPIFTPLLDPNTWLAVKIHAGSADTLVHSIYSHAILMHFVMCNVWTAANRMLSTEHPIHAFLKPHFWSTLYVTDIVKGSMDKVSGEQIKAYGTGLPGQNHFVAQLYQGLDFSRYNPHVDFDKRGVLDATVLPQFHYRDDALELWKAHASYVEAMLGQYYASDDDVKADSELQAWMAELASASGAAITTGLPVNPATGQIESRGQLFELLTMVLFTVTTRHSSIENGALEYLYTPANPFIYRLDAPTTPAHTMTLEQVADALPPITKAILGWSLIKTADFDHEDFGGLGEYEDDFTDDWPTETDAIVQAWKDKLDDIEALIDARNATLQVPYTGLKPSKTFNSIWN